MKERGLVPRDTSGAFRCYRVSLLKKLDFAVIKSRGSLEEDQGMRKSAVTVALVTAIGVSFCFRSGALCDEPIIWEQGSLSLWKEEYHRELQSIASFAARKPAVGDSRAAHQDRIDRVIALKVLGGMQPSVGARDIAESNLSFYYKNIAATEGRYAITDWPGADALARMGSLACPALLTRMEMPCDELDIRLLAQIFIRIDGRELATHRLKIRQREYAKLNRPPLDEDDFWQNLRRVVAILEDPEYSDEKYSPTEHFKANMK